MSRFVSKFLSKNGGFLALEAVLGLIILTLVGIVSGLTVVKITHQLIHQREAKKAAKLGDMVMEFYGNQATQNFYNLGLLNQPTPVPAQTFLKLSYNPGNFYVTTNAQWDDTQERANCLI